MAKKKRKPDPVRTWFFIVLGISLIVYSALYWFVLRGGELWSLQL